MSTPGYIATYPHPFLDPTGTQVDVFQFRPDNLQDLLTWSGGTDLGVINGAPLVMLPGSLPTAQLLVGLGDFVVKTATSVESYRGDGFFQEFTPV